MEKSARVSEKLVSPGLPGLQVATRLPYIKRCTNTNSKGKENVFFSLRCNVLLRKGHYNALVLNSGEIHSEILLFSKNVPF